MQDNGPHSEWSECWFCRLIARFWLGMAILVGPMAISTHSFPEVRIYAVSLVTPALRAITRDDRSQSYTVALHEPTILIKAPAHASSTFTAMLFDSSIRKFPPQVVTVALETEVMTSSNAADPLAIADRQAFHVSFVESESEAAAKPHSPSVVAVISMRGPEASVKDTISAPRTPPLYAVLEAIPGQARAGSHNRPWFGPPGVQLNAEQLAHVRDWAQSLRRIVEAQSRSSISCAFTGAGDCPWSDLQSALPELRRLPLTDRVRRVNRLVNRVPYRMDSVNFGAADYWATPDEFYSRGGDCEDYAIAKYFALKELGVPPNDMRLLVLTNLDWNQPHAVLLVKNSNEVLILDNLSDQVVDWRARPYYRAQYSINEQGVWLHGAPPPALAGVSKIN
jgi:predicted transglutaminase-like cysteine proteinase